MATTTAIRDLLDSAAPDAGEPEEELSAPPELTDTERNGLRELVKGCMEEDRTARYAEIRKAWQQRSYRNGRQHLFWDTSLNTYLAPSASGRELPRFMDVWNIYEPHWRSFVSILSSPIKIQFQPDDITVPADVTAASYANKERARVDQRLKMRDRQGEAAGLFCTDGLAATWSRIDSKGVLRCTVHGVLETKRPIYLRHMEDWGYFAIAEEIDLLEAQDEWEEFADEIEGADELTDSNSARLARLGVIGTKRGGLAETSRNLTTRYTVWLRPSRYRKAGRKQREGAAADALRDRLRELFPDGVRVTVIGGEVVDAQPERMEDAVCCEWSSPGQGGTRPSLLHSILDPQDALNDYMNMLRDQATRINPATWVDESLVDPEALAEQRSESGAMHSVTVDPAVGDIRKLLFQEQSNGMSADLVAACQQLMTFAEFTSGDLPSIYGAATEGQETVGVNRMLTASAKGQLSNGWGGLQWLFAGTFVILVKLSASQAGDQTVTVEGQTGREQFNPAAILEGRFGCFPDPDATLPETMADKADALRDVLTSLSAADPTIAMRPGNLKLVKQYSRLPELEIPGANSRDKQLREIAQLLAEVPVPPPGAMDIPANGQAMQVWMAQAAAAQAQGAPPPPLPPLVDAQGQPLQYVASVGIDATWDQHQFERDEVQDWVNSEAYEEEKRKGNLLGLQNVKLHGQMHADALAKAAAAANQPQQTPMAISGNFKDLDPQTKVQVLQRDGYQPDAGSYETNQGLEQQGTAADTAETAANAQHKAVLAHVEATKPSLVKPVPRPANNGVGA